MLFKMYRFRDTTRCVFIRDDINLPLVNPLFSETRLRFEIKVKKNKSKADNICHILRIAMLAFLLLHLAT